MMAATVESRLTDRDCLLLRSLQEYRLLTVAQLERLHFPSAQTARRRLRHLEQRGHVRLFRAAGIAERLVALTPAGLRHVASDQEGGASLGIPRHPLFVAHFLAAAELRISLTLSCQERSEVELTGFIPEYRSTQRPGQPPLRVLRDEVQLGGSTLSHTPDGAFVLRRGSATALFFLEIDRGTEVLGHEAHGVGKAMWFYLQYLASGGYRRLEREFNCGELRGFRLLFVTSSPRRLENIRQRCGAVPFEPTVAKRFIWLATQTVLKDKGLLEHRWSSLDPSDLSLYTIAPPPQP